MKATRSQFALAGAMTLSLTLSRPASALSFVDQVPQEVQFGDTQNLVLKANNVLYSAQPTSPGCALPGPGLETLKVWASLSQAGLLSGKLVRIYFDVCNGKNYVRSIVLQR